MQCRDTVSVGSVVCCCIDGYRESSIQNRGVRIGFESNTPRDRSSTVKQQAMIISFLANLASSMHQVVYLDIYLCLPALFSHLTFRQTTILSEQSNDNDNVPSPCSRICYRWLALLQGWSTQIFINTSASITLTLHRPPIKKNRQSYLARQMDCLEEERLSRFSSW